MGRHLQETAWFSGYFRRKGRAVGQTVLPTCKEEVLNAEKVGVNWARDKRKMPFAACSV